MTDSVTSSAKKELAARRRRVVDNNKPQKVKGSASTKPQAPSRAAQPTGRTPAAQRPGSLTSTLRGTLRAVARTDAARIRELEAITGQKIKPTAAGARAGAEAGARVRGAAKGGKVAGTLRAGLRELAQSDARTAREMAAIVRDATPKVAGGKGGKAIRGGRAALPAGKPAAGKQQPQKPSKKPVNKAQRAYLAARSNARSRGGDLRGADAGSRRMASSAAAVVRNMERRRSAAVPKSPADSPRAKQQQRQAARAQRAIRNQRAAMAREADGPGSKASRSASVARRAQQIYAGKVDPKAKTKSRLTKTRDPEVLRKRIAKIKDSTARAAAKAAAKEAKAAAKPAKTATPVRPATSNRPKRSLAVRAAKADKADRKLKAQLKQAIASGNEKKIIELNFRRRRIDRFSETYNFADIKASRKALTPAKPTAPKRTRSARPAGTVAKPRGMKPGVLAARRKRKAAPTAAQFSLLSARAKEKAARIRRRAGSRFAQANEQDRAAIKKATSTKTAGNRNKANKALRSAMVMQKAVRVLTGQITPSATRRPLATRLY
jgi:hypothetical protein